MIPGVDIRQNFLAAEEEVALLAAADSRPWEARHDKRWQFFFAPEIPPEFLALAARLGHGEPYRLILSDYAPGQGMEPHRDVEPYPDIVGCIVSLNGDAEWCFVHGNVRTRLRVPRRSLFTFTGEARYQWSHSVFPVTERRVSLYFSFRGKDNGP